MSDIETMVWNTDVGDEPGLFPTYMAKYMAAALARRAYRTGAAHFSQSAMARTTGCSPRAVWAALRALEGAGLLRRERRGRDGKRMSDRLIFTLRSVTITIEEEDDDDGLVDPRRFGPKPAPDASGAKPREERRASAPGAKQRHSTKTEEAKASSSSTARAISKRNVAPDDWEPKDSHRDKADAFGWPSGMMEEQAERFKEWEFREPKTDFDRAFHRWLRTENDRLKGRPNGPGLDGAGFAPRGGSPSRHDRLAAMQRGALAAVDHFQRKR